MDKDNYPKVNDKVVYIYHCEGLRHHERERGIVQSVSKNTVQVFFLSDNSTHRIACYNLAVVARGTKWKVILN